MNSELPCLILTRLLEFAGADESTKKQCSTMIQELSASFGRKRIAAATVVLDKVIRAACDGESYDKYFYRDDMLEVNVLRNTVGWLNVPFAENEDSTVETATFKRAKVIISAPAYDEEGTMASRIQVLPSK